MGEHKNLLILFLPPEKKSRRRAFLLFLLSVSAVSLFPLYAFPFIYIQQSIIFKGESESEGAKQGEI